MPSEAALGFRAHSGWAALVALGGPADAPSLLERTRVSLAGSSAQGAVQPYHAAAKIDLCEADLFIQRLTVDTVAFAHQGLEKILARLRKHGFTVGGCAILFASGRPLGTLGQILASHAMIHTAEGEFFRNAIVRASEELALPVTRIRERELWDEAGKRVNLPAGRLQDRLAAIGKAAGPPWRQDQKFAALAAWIALTKLA